MLYLSKPLYLIVAKKEIAMTRYSAGDVVGILIFFFWFIVFIINIIIGIVLLVQINKMDPLETGEVVTGIYTIKNWYVNPYLVEVGDGKYIIIDTGRDSPGVKKGLVELDIEREDVVAVFLTHTDTDHINGLKLFKNAEVYAGAESKHRKVSEKMSDGQVVDIGGVKVKCIFTPGRTYDSVCYLVDGKYLFAGDTLSLHDGEVGLFNKVYNKSDEMQAESIQKLADLSGIEYIFSAHYGFTSNPIFP